MSTSGVGHEVEAISADLPQTLRKLSGTRGSRALVFRDVDGLIFIFSPMRTVNEKTCAVSRVSRRLKANRRRPD